ncbi:15068_t:CDS:1, partial [Rhizophagus irregularis]
VPIVTTYTESGVETPTPVPENIKLTTTETTLTSYFAGYSTTNSLGDPTFVPPSTLYVVKSMAVTEAPTSTVVSDSATILHDTNSHGLWGVTMSLT